MKTSMFARIIDRDDELKKHSETSPEIQTTELNEQYRNTVPDQEMS